MADAIDGVPEKMGAYTTDNNLREVTPTSPLRSAMAEGKAFAAKDEAAGKELEGFLTNTGQRLVQATRTAKDAKLEYINADQDAWVGLQNVAFRTVFVSNDRISNPFI